ncbi:MAG: DNA-binding protein [Pseudomonas sp.]|nr:DNA-binding protein [Pseudomonas sp.]MDZ4190419.1 DNA-binding protein [Pseudomonas sp.]
MSTGNAYLVIPPFCTREEFARLTGLLEKGPEVVRGMCNQSTLPTVQVGRHQLVNVRKLLQDLDLGKTEFLAGDYL